MENKGKGMKIVPNIKVLRDPGFLYDLNYLFYTKFNRQICIDNISDERKKEEYKLHLDKISDFFGEISDDLYVFYHAIANGRCFMTTFYMDPYKNRFISDFDFKFFKNLLSNTGKVIKNLIRFYLYNLSEEEFDVCISSTPELFSYIKQSKYSDSEKSKLYEFFINPTPYIQALQYELIEKEILLSNYYKDNYDKIIEAHNNTTFEILCTPINGEKDFSFLEDNEQTLYTSYCLLNKYYMKDIFMQEGMIYLLGYDFASAISEYVEKSKKPLLKDLCNALSEESRIQILKLLIERREVTCKDLEKIFSFSGSTAYHHITLLTKIGAVKVRNEGKTIYYSLNRDYFDTVIDNLKVFSNNKK